MSQRTIEIEGDTLEEARTLLKSQMGDSLAVISESIDSDGMPKTVRVVADTLEDATSKAQEQLPANARILETRNGFATPRLRSYMEWGNREEVVREKAKTMGKQSPGEEIESIKLQVRGSKGFLGLWATPNLYKVTFQKPQVLVEISYVIRARIRATIGNRDDVIKWLDKSAIARNEEAKQRLRWLRNICDSTELVSQAPDLFRKLLGCNDDELGNLAFLTIAESDPSVIKCLLRFHSLTYGCYGYNTVDSSKSYDNLYKAIKKFGESATGCMFEFLRTDTQSKGGSRLAIALLKEIGDSRIVRVIADRLMNLDEHDDPSWLYESLQDALHKHLASVGMEDVKFIQAMTPREFKYQSREIDVNYDRVFDYTAKLDFSELKCLASEELMRRAHSS